MVASPKESLHREHIYLTQRDIRELQLAKGAIGAGIDILMREMGVTLEDIDVIYLAGALGNYVNPYSAMRIGLIPMADPDKIVSLGNAASTGAKMVLLSKTLWTKASEAVDHVEHIELSTHPAFYESFIESMRFPDRNLW